MCMKAWWDGAWQDWVRLFSMVGSDRTRCNRNRLKYREFPWTIRKKKWNWEAWRTQVTEKIKWQIWHDISTRGFTSLLEEHLRCEALGSINWKRLSIPGRAWQGSLEDCHFHCCHSQDTLKEKGKNFSKHNCFSNILAYLHSAYKTLSTVAQVSAASLLFHPQAKFDTSKFCSDNRVLHN